MTDRQRWTDEALDERFGAIRSDIARINGLPQTVALIGQSLEHMAQAVKECHSSVATLSAELKEEQRGLSRGEKISLGVLCVAILGTVVAVAGLLVGA